MIPPKLVLEGSGRPSDATIEAPHRRRGKEPKFPSPVCGEICFFMKFRLKSPDFNIVPFVDTIHNPLSKFGDRAKDHITIVGLLTSQVLPFI